MNKLLNSEFKPAFIGLGDTAVSYSTIHSEILAYIAQDIFLGETLNEELLKEKVSYVLTNYSYIGKAITRIQMFIDYLNSSNRNSNFVSPDMLSFLGSLMDSEVLKSIDIANQVIGSISDSIYRDVQVIIPRIKNYEDRKKVLPIHELHRFDSWNSESIDKYLQSN